MLNLRVVAALTAAQIFLIVVVWPDAPPLLGVLLGIGAGAVINYLDRLLLSRTPAAGNPVAGPRPQTFVALSAVAAFATLAAFYFVLKGPSGAPWLGIGMTVVAVVGLVLSSLKLNRMVREASA
jgi:hypothetical protein